MLSNEIFCFDIVELDLFVAKIFLVKPVISNVSLGSPISYGVYNAVWLTIRLYKHG